MIKCIVFDWYGVCTNLPWRETFSTELGVKLCIDPEKVESLFRKHCKEYEIDSIGGKEFIELVCRDLDCKPDKFYYLIDAQPAINWEVMDLIKTLKKKYRIILLSNHYSDIWDDVKKEIGDPKDYFDYTLFSFDMKIRKQESEVYKILLDTANAESSEIIFIDDQQKPRETAEKLGIRTIPFKNYRDLLSQLKELGIS